MSSFRPDIALSMLKEAIFQVEEVGPLYSPILSLDMVRDSKMELHLETLSEHHAKSEAKVFPAGTVRRTEEYVTLVVNGSTRIRLSGVQPLGYEVSTNQSGMSIRAEKARVQKVSVDILPSASGRYLVQWLENVDDRSFVWPNITKYKESTGRSTIVGSGDDEIEILNSATGSGFCRNSLHLNCEGLSLYLVASEEAPSGTRVKPGYLLFDGVPCEELRTKIVDCLSFILGRPLISTGITVFDGNWHPIYAESESAYSIGDAMLAIPSLPPSPLGRSFQGEIDENIVSEMFLSFYAIYEDYQFGHLMWLYWHAICAPVHVAGVHFGACIELLQKSYIENNPGEFSHKVLSKASWRELRHNMLEVLSEAGIAVEASEVLKNKINLLNQAPQSKVNERFFSSIGMNFSQFEIAAWRQRNNAAHGNKVEGDNHIDLIREIKILKVLLHRILLRISIHQGYYVDYYTMGFPVREISESIETTD